MKQFSAIIARAELVRENKRLTKSNFAASMGIPPQTYSNFLNSKHSKPSIALISGMLEAHGVDPLWLTSGKGEAHLKAGTDEYVQAPVGDTTRGFFNEIPSSEEARTEDSVLMVMLELSAQITRIREEQIEIKGLFHDYLKAIRPFLPHG